VENFKYDISQYKLKKKLGEGGMATVYLAENTKFRTDVAIKFLNIEFTHNENIRKRFLAEARNMFKMSHPNIVRVTDLVEEDRMVAFVMEYIEGGTLKEYQQKQSKLKNEEIKQLFLQMLDAVDYVHNHGFIHRDIKPSNFMLTKEGKIKLLDFGIAKNTEKDKENDTLTGTNSILGTPLYMSPEQIKSTKSVTCQSDIYSLGVLLWEMTMGKKPYDVKTISTFELQTKIVNEKLPITNTKWDAIIKKATENELSNRYRTVLDFANDVMKLDFSLPKAPTVAPKIPLKEVDKEATSVAVVPFSTNYVVKNNQDQKKKNHPSKKIIFSVLAILLLILLVKCFYYHKASNVISDIEKDMAFVTGGSFDMGCGSSSGSLFGYNDDCQTDEQPLHRIQLNDYSIGKFEITQSQWEAIMGAKKFHFEGCDDCPAEMVSWIEVQEFLKIISDHTGKRYRLPTEAEWEYAARSGQNENDYLYAANNDLDEVAWYVKNSGKKTHPVGGKIPNELGIYDMTGNVREWCSDWYGEAYYSNLEPGAENPKGPSFSSSDPAGRVLRGASWSTGTRVVTKKESIKKIENKCRILTRWNMKENERNEYNGFRVVRESK
jgi:serine/threonine protein kinase